VPGPSLGRRVPDAGAPVEVSYDRVLYNSMKARLTISLDARLLAFVDRAVGRSPDLGSRSGVIEEAVRRWSRSQYDASIRDYYAHRTESEHRADDSWAELSAGELSAVIAREAPARYAVARKRAPRRRRR